MSGYTEIFPVAVGLDGTAEKIARAYLKLWLDYRGEFPLSEAVPDDDLPLMKIELGDEPSQDGWIPASVVILYYDIKLNTKPDGAKLRIPISLGIDRDSARPLYRITRSHGVQENFLDWGPVLSLSDFGFPVPTA